jgi:hypothetical protein
MSDSGTPPTDPSGSDDLPVDVTESTIEADEHDAEAAHVADRPPTEQEEHDAEQAGAVPPESAEAYREAIERGAKVKGEGAIDL